MKSQFSANLNKIMGKNELEKNPHPVYFIPNTCIETLKIKTNPQIDKSILIQRHKH